MQTPRPAARSWPARLVASLWRPENASTLLALAAGAALRLSIVPLARWNDDENGLYSVALDIARGTGFPAFGPPITDTPAQLPGPALHYFHALALVLGRGHPYAVGALVTALHLAGIAVFALAVRRTVSAHAGVIVAWLLALSPWDVLFSDRPYNPNVCLGAFTLMLGAFALGHREGRGALQALAVFLALVVPQTHLSSVVALPALAAMALAGARAGRAEGRSPTLRWRWIAAGALLGAFTYTPALLSELHTNFENLRRMRAMGLGGARDAYEWARSLVAPFFFASDEIGWHVLRGYWNPRVDPVLYPRDAELWRAAGTFYGPWRVVVVASFAVAVAAHAAYLLRLPLARARLLVGDVWTPVYVVVLGGCAALLAAGHKIYFPHYNVIALPLAALVVARGLATLSARGRAGVAAVAVWVALAGAAGTAVVRKYYTDIDGLTGIGRQREIVAIICERQQGSSFGVVFDYFNEIGLYRTLAARAGCDWAEVPPGQTNVRYWVQPADHPPPYVPPGAGRRVWDLPPLRVTLIAPEGDPLLR